MKRWGNVAGSVFAVLVISTVIYLYGDDLGTVDFSNGANWSNLAGSVALYVSVILIGGFGWRILLNAFGAASEAWVAERHLLLSQIGKYVPGNIAQYLGRAAMTMKTGVSAKTVGMALITETVATVIGGILAVAILILLSPDLAEVVSKLLPQGAHVVWLVVAVAAFLLVLIGARFLSNSNAIWTKWPKVRLSGLMAAILLYTLSFLLLGASLNLVIGVVSSSVVPLSLTVLVFAAAWIAGLATPGAPGGLGIRETVIALGLAPVIGGGAGLSVALLHRGVSVFGDVISFGLGMLLLKIGRLEQ
jgi:glycosyltransferase 2 family protein